MKSTCEVCGTTIRKSTNGIIEGNEVWLDSDGIECSSVPVFHDHEEAVGCTVVIDKRTGEVV